MELRVQMNRVVVTGGSGKAGRAVVADLREHGVLAALCDQISPVTLDESGYHPNGLHWRRHGVGYSISPRSVYIGYA